MEAKILNNDKMDKVLQKSLSDMNKKLQTGLALGAMVLRPLGPDTAEYVAADKFIVISFSDDGTPNDIAFLVVKCAGENDYYTRVERHYFTNDNLTIENKCYHSQSQSDIGADLRSGRGGGMGEHSSRTGYLSGNGSDGLWILPKSD